MKNLSCLIFMILAGNGIAAQSLLGAGKTMELSVETVQDKIRGGSLGHMLGDLNGLKHEMRYIDEPGNVQEYAPALPEGAWTDDDTDFEWVYLLAMQKSGVLMLSQKEIPPLWKSHINRSFWCANQYARQLMDLGIEPPLTGQIHFNPWSDFNISGQFVCESFGLIAPGMPQTAARLGLNYTHVTIENEPAQTTQLFDSMIATAFLTSDINQILDAGVAAVDPQSVVCQVVKDVRAWRRQYPQDWRATRRLVKEKYSQYHGEIRDRNGFELNTASVIGALLYGESDFVKTAIAAFNFGWDADNNAATACTVVGVMKGYRWMMAQGWNIKDLFRNTTRDKMPQDETITSFNDRLVELAERVIVERGGQKLTVDGKAVYRICLETPGNIEKLPDLTAEFARLQKDLKPEIEAAIAREANPESQARAVYLAMCLDLAPALQQKYPTQWTKALIALYGFPNILQALFFEADTPAGEKLRSRALAVGINRPSVKMKIW
jgi:ADP-ribosylglycohydrolase